MKKSEIKIVNELCDIEEGMTDWEVEFVESLSHYPEDRVLTDNQKRTLAKIEDKYLNRMYDISIPKDDYLDD